MSIKGKILSVISFVCLAVALFMVGVWAVTETDFKVSGNIEYVVPIPTEADYPYLTFSFSDEEAEAVSLMSTRSTTPLTASVVDCSTDASVVTEAVVPEKIKHNDKVYIVTTIAGGSSSTGAFYNCTNLTSIELPQTVTIIESYAFAGTGLTSIEIPNSVTSIGGFAFHNCKGLTSIEIPNSVTSIGSSAFYNCRGLASVTIGSGVTSIGSYAFTYCSGLTSIIVDENNTIYDSRDNCNAIIETSSNTLIQGFSKTIIPASVTSIGNYAFYDCSGLTSMTIGSGVTRIGTYAFKNCTSLASVTIGSGVTSIVSNAFNGCSALTTVVIDSSTVASGLTTTTAQGRLIYYATKVYVKSGLSVGSYLSNTANFTVGTSDKTGYVLYNKV